MKVSALAAAAALAALTSLGAARAHAEDFVVAALPDNLIEASELDAQNGVEDFVLEGKGDDEAMAFELDHPGAGHGHHGGYHPRHPSHPGHPRHPHHPGYPHHPRPYPYPRPWPHPYPYPPVRYPVPRPLVTCFALSTANGQIYSASDYSARWAEDEALRRCYYATGFECVPRGCR